MAATELTVSAGAEIKQITKSTESDASLERVEREIIDREEMEEDEDESGIHDEVYARYVKRRDALGMIDADVSRKSGVKAYDLSKWKRGKYMPKTLKLIAIARALETTVEWLVMGEGLGVDKDGAPLAFMTPIPHSTDYGEQAEDGFLQHEYAIDYKSRAADDRSGGRKTISAENPADEGSEGSAPQVGTSFRYNDTIDALQHLSPKKRNLVDALIAVCAEE